MSRSSNVRLRQRGLEARRNLDAFDRRYRSAKIQRRFLRSNLFLSASNIACYLSASDEVDTSLIFERCWRSNKKVFAPVIGAGHSMKFVEVRPNSDLRKNRYGLWEPVIGAKIHPCSLDLVVTPVVAYDDAAHRIGMGGGYYDRAFAFLRYRKNWLRPKLAGLAFDCQKVKKIKANPWDIRLCRIFSEAD